MKYFSIKNLLIGTLAVLFYKTIDIVLDQVIEKGTKVVHKYKAHQRKSKDKAKLQLKVV